MAICLNHYQNLKTTEVKDKIKYSIYADKNGQLIQAIGIGFQTPNTVKSYIVNKAQLGKAADVSPVPTVLVVDKKRKILFEYISPNYKKRISSGMFLAVLKSLSK